MADELGRWLRRVRPPTAADDNWATSSEADQILAAVHRETTHAGRPASRQRGRDSVRWLPAGVLAAVAAVVVAVAVTSTPSTGPGDHGFAPPEGSGGTALPRPAIRPASFLLSTDSSCAGLLTQLREHAAASVQPYGLPGVATGGYYGPGLNFRGSFGPADLGPTSSSAILDSGTAKSVNGSTSTTNIQEPGVDEPDIVKTDGDRLITVTDGVLRVIDTATRAVTGTLDLTMYSGWEGAQLLVDGSQALVTLSAYPASGYIYGGRANSAAVQSNYLFVSLAGQPKVTGSLRASGTYLDARMVGSTVRLVVRSAPVINLPVPYANTARTKSANQKAIRAAPLSAWLPKYTVTSSAGTVSGTVGCDRTSHPKDFTGSSMLTIYTLDMTHLGDDPNPVTVAADGDTVYANSSSLYIASNPQWYCCTASTKQNTEVHRFDISGAGSPAYLGSGLVSGRLLNSYSLSDDDGYLRIATTTNGENGSAAASNGVTVLADDTLKVTGRVDGLGKGERIYAVRFLGSMAYVVTYRQTDPLYVVDLHDPTAPKVVGALTLSGVSTYLHDLGNGLLLGVGQSLTQGEGAGVQVSLFDVSKPTQPKRISNVVVPNTPAELAFDPHTFLYWAPTGLIVNPIRTWSGSQSGRVLATRVAGHTLTKVGEVVNPRPATVPDDGLGIQRSLIVNGDLWTVSGGGVQVSNQSNLDPVVWIPYQ